VAEFRALLTQLAEQGKTVFLSSHDLPEVQVLCHRVAILAKGRLLYQGTVSDLLHKQIGQRVRLQIGFESPGMLQAALALLQAQQQGEAAEWLFEVQHGAATPQGQLQVEVKTGYASAVNALLAQHQLFASELHRIETTLEQYFLSLTAASAESGRAPGQSPSPASVFVSARAAQPSRLTSTS
jgi:ABC-2 type transport system ATP-binding protein